jgi:hypothetical protein
MTEEGWKEKRIKKGLEGKEGKIDMKASCTANSSRGLHMFIGLKPSLRSNGIQG